MSNNYWNDEEDEDTQDAIPQTEADLVKQLRKQLKLKDKQINELQGENQSFKKVNRESAVKSILEKKGVSAKASNLILKDIEGEVSEEAVSKWLADYAEVLNIKVDPKPETPETSDDNRAALSQQDNLTAGAKTPTNTTSLEAKLDDPNMSEDEFWQVFGKK